MNLYNKASKQYGAEMFNGKFMSDLHFFFNPSKETAQHLCSLSGEEYEEDMELTNLVGTAVTIDNELYFYFVKSEKHDRTSYETNFDLLFDLKDPLNESLLNSYNDLKKCYDTYYICAELNSKIKDYETQIFLARYIQNLYDNYKSLSERYKQQRHQVCIVQQHKDISPWFGSLWLIGCIIVWIKENIVIGIFSFLIFGPLTILTVTLINAFNIKTRHMEGIYDKQKDLKDYATIGIGVHSLYKTIKNYTKKK